MKAPSVAPHVLLTRVDALGDPGALVCDARGVAIIVTRRAGVIAAFHNLCPHAGYPLQNASGRIVVQQERYMLCCGHGASFVLETGACAGGPCNGAGLTPVAIVVRDGMVLTA